MEEQSHIFGVHRLGIMLLLLSLFGCTHCLFIFLIVWGCKYFVYSQARQIFNNKTIFLEKTVIKEVFETKRTTLVYYLQNEPKYGLL